MKTLGEIKWYCKEPNADGMNKNTGGKLSNKKIIEHHRIISSILTQAEKEMLTVSKQLGHEKVSTTTDIYSHLIDQVSDKASECMADVVLRKKA